jgi:hypothetical protein
MTKPDMINKIDIIPADPMIDFITPSSAILFIIFAPTYK